VWILRRACYDEGKRCAIFNTYGPRMHENDGRVVSSFVVQALSGKPLTVFSDGKQTRSFCYVSDLIEGFVPLESIDRRALLYPAGAPERPAESAAAPPGATRAAPENPLTSSVSCTRSVP
jgi:nucleoside-diphosphate-sugar epimerase